mgnify:CR=1 FL=1
MEWTDIRLTVAKMLLGSMSPLAGLSAGREGPSVQVAAGVMHNARRWLRPARCACGDPGRRDEIEQGICPFMAQASAGNPSHNRS